MIGLRTVRLVTSSGTAEQTQKVTTIADKISRPFEFDIYLVGCILSEAVWPGAYGAGKLHSRYLLVEEEAASAGQVNHQALQMHQILHI